MILLRGGRLLFDAIVLRSGRKGMMRSDCKALREWVCRGTYVAMDEGMGG
jgi:hypothetical protein